MDNGGTANGGVNTVTADLHGDGHAGQPGAHARPDRQPRRDPREHRTPQTINLTGITAGPGDDGADPDRHRRQQQPGADPQPDGHLHQPAAPTGTLTYTPVPNASGTATITVTVNDNGGTANGGVNTVTQTFTVTVTPVNQPPTLNPIANPAAILENCRAADGHPDGHHRRPRRRPQILTVTATSSNPALIPNPTVTYTSPEHDRHADLHAGGQRQRHGDDHRHGDGQRRHRQRRRQHGHPDVHRDRHAGQPGAHARPDRQPRRRSSRTPAPQTVNLTGITAGLGDDRRRS